MPRTIWFSDANTEGARYMPMLRQVKASECQEAILLVVVELGEASTAGARASPFLAWCDFGARPLPVSTPPRSASGRNAGTSAFLVASDGADDRSQEVAPA